MVATATKPGSSYVALTNLSLPRPGRKDDDPNDLVPSGEIAVLTDEQAAPFISRADGGTRNGPSVIRLLSAVKGTGIDPRLPPRAVAGAIRQPPPPPPGSDQPRPDPPGSSAIQVWETLPEAMEPQPGTEGAYGADPAVVARIEDAMDIAPGSRRR